MSILRSSLILICIIGTILLSGCYGYRVAVPEPDPVSEYESQMGHSLFWGLMQKPQYIVASNCTGNAVDEVYVTTNLGYSLLNLISLGIWAPLELSWRCAEGTTDEGHDDGSL